MRMIVLALILVAAACTSQGEAASTAAQPDVAASEPPTSADVAVPALDLAACDADAEPGLRAVRVAMAAVTDQPLGSLIGGAWNDLAAADPAYEQARAELDGRGLTCRSAEIVSVRIIELADHALPGNAAEAVVWVESIGPTAAIASRIAPEEAQTYVDPVSGSDPGWPIAGDYRAAASCAEVAEQAVDTARGYLAMWSAQNPLDAAAGPPPLEYAIEVQAGRLRAAELGCDPSDHAEALFAALTTTPTDSFVSRGLRVTYAGWILSTMLADAANPDPVVARVVADPAGGLAGVSIVNRSDQPQTGISLEVNGEGLVGDLSLAAGEVSWIPALSPTLESLTLDWDR